MYGNRCALFKPDLLVIFACYQNNEFMSPIRGINHVSSFEGINLKEWERRKKNIGVHE